MHDWYRSTIRPQPLVRCGKPAQNSDADRRDELPSRRLVALHVPANPRTEIDAVDPLEHHVVAAVVVDEVVHLGDVRRLQHRAEPRLLDEHRHVRRLLCEILVHLFDRDVSDEPRVAAHAAAPDVGHSTASGDLEELVATADDRAGPRIVSHNAITSSHNLDAQSCAEDRRTDGNLGSWRAARAWPGSARSW